MVMIMVVVVWVEIMYIAGPLLVLPTYSTYYFFLTTTLINST